MEVTDCPFRQCGRHAFDVIRLADLTKRGLAPIAGGSMDQSHAFMEACRLVWNDQSYYRAKHGILDNG